MASEKKVRAVKSRHSLQLLSQPGVSGVGVEKDDNGDYVLAVHVDADNADAAETIPEMIEGCRVKVLRSGPFRKSAKRQK